MELDMSFYWYTDTANQLNYDEIKAKAFFVYTTN